MLRYLVAVLLIFALSVGWVVVQRAAQRVHERCPDPAATGEGDEEGQGGCGLCKLAGACQQRRDDTAQ